MHFSCLVFSNSGTEQEIEGVMAPYQENNWGDVDEEFLRPFYEGEYYEDLQELKAEHPEAKDEDIYLSNPDAQWDYWGIIDERKVWVLKDGSRSCNAMLKDIDLDATFDYWQKYQKEHNYERFMSLPIYAWVGINGEWNETGLEKDISDESFRKMLEEIKATNEETYATILDCHM